MASQFREYKVRHFTSLKGNHKFVLLPDLLGGNLMVIWPFVFCRAFDCLALMQMCSGSKIVLRRIFSNRNIGASLKKTTHSSSMNTNQQDNKQGLPGRTKLHHALPLTSRLRLFSELHPPQY